MFDAKKIKADFPILSTKVHGHDLVYLDSGATAQKPRSVLLKIEQLYNNLNANIHRGVHHLSEATTQEYEAAREKVRSFIGAESCSEIIFTAGATSAINTVAYSFAERFIGRGDNVVVSEMEHHSNLVPWQMICQMKGAELRMLPFDDNGEIIYDKLDELVDEHTRILAITQASNVLGTMPDLKRVIDFCHSRNVPVMVDGCQGVVHQKFLAPQIGVCVVAVGAFTAAAAGAVGGVVNGHIGGVIGHASSEHQLGGGKRELFLHVVGQRLGDGHRAKYHDNRFAGILRPLCALFDGVV